VRLIQCENIDEDRSLRLEFIRPLNDFHNSDFESQCLHIMMPPAVISVYFPKSPGDKPFCFCGDTNESTIDQQFSSGIASAAEAANEVYHGAHLAPKLNIQPIIT
jgi:hypothetical protein